MTAAAAASTSHSSLPMRVQARRPCRRGGGLLSSRSPEQDDDGAAGSWRDLPSDLYGRVLRRLPSCGDRVRLRAVCRHWRACARQHVPRCQARLPTRVTRTPRGTHVVHLRGFSRLLEEHCVGGFVDSPAFAVAGLHWAIRYYPGGSGSGGGKGHVGVFVMLLTQGVVARAYVGLLLLDQTTGLADTTVVWDRWRTRFDAASACCARGAAEVATRSELKGSRFVRGDCLKIECVLHDVDVGRIACRMC